jgi:tRNA1(Val) A37 N6-methylase TrmN6
MTTTTTLDGLLDRRITIEQPVNGFRVAVDTLLLAAALTPVEGANVLDLGCGVGGAMLALACRVQDVCVTGMEIQDDLARLCEANIARNALPADLRVRDGDVTRLPSGMKAYFDHVMMNPPYHDSERHDASPREGKRIANTGTADGLALWLASAAFALKNGGTLTMIHRADRKDAVVGCLNEDFGDVRLKFIVTKPEAPPKRVLLRAQKGAKAGIVESPPFIMHKPDGAYTPEAEAVLRHAAALPFDEPASF